MDIWGVLGLGLMYLLSVLLAAMAIEQFLKDHGSLTNIINDATPKPLRGIVMTGLIVLWPVYLAVTIVLVTVIGLPMNIIDAVRNIRRATRR